MSPDDVSPDEMGIHRHDEGDELQDLLEGSAHARERLPELGAFIDDVRSLPTPSPEVETRHVTAMMTQAHLLADKGDPVARPVSNANGPAEQVSGLPMRRSIPMVKLVLTKVMAPLLAVFTLMGGLAYAQALPSPLQDAVQGVAGAVGIDLPGSEDEGDPADEVDDDADDVDADDEGDDVTDESDDDQGDQGDDDQGDQGDDDQGDQGDDDQGGSGGGSDDDDSDDSDQGGSDDDSDEDDSDEDDSDDEDDSEDEDDSDEDDSDDEGDDA